MPVLLSSRGIPDPRGLEALLSVALADSVVALVPNARDGLTEADRGEKVRETLAHLEDLGTRIEMLDLRVVDENLVQEALRRTDWCWVMGGDPFILRTAMSRSGFDREVVQRVSAGYTYAGESAGAIVAGLSLRGFDHGDDSDGPPEVDRSGLGLVSDVVLPHVGSADFADAIRIARAANPGSHFLEIADGGQRSFL